MVQGMVALSHLILLLYAMPRVLSRSTARLRNARWSADGLAPQWPVTYDMQRSTIIQPCNMSGFLEPTAFYAQFGVVDVDWSNAKALWTTPPMQTEELLLTQAAMLKAVNPDIRVFVYRNLVKALPWYTSVRQKINDPAYSGWFLRFAPNTTYHVPACDNNWSPPRCSGYYHDQEQTPEYPSGDGNCPGPCDCGGVPCGEYLWDWRNGSSILDWAVNEHFLGPTGLGNANVSGFFIDDLWFNQSSWDGGCAGNSIGGPTEIDGHCDSDMGLQQADTTALTDGWTQAMEQVQQAVVAHGGWGWQYFKTFSTPNQANCASTLRPLCTAGNSSWYHSNTMYHQFTIANQTRPDILPHFTEDLSTFMLLRGDYAWLGYGWINCSVPYSFPDPLKGDYGRPTGSCRETGTGTGVFTRDWTQASVVMDCNSYTGTVTMKASPHAAE